MNKLLERNNLLEIPRVSMNLILGIVDVFVHPVIATLVDRIAPSQEEIDAIIQEASIQYFSTDKGEM